MEVADTKRLLNACLKSSWQQRKAIPKEKNLDINFVKSEERVVFMLRSLYQKYGYLPYTMSKFEEYELYMQHKEFMISDRVITFNDTNGRLMALKPDVTMSIIKSGEDAEGAKQKVYYNENVYRVSGSTHRFKEIMQVGLECIGDTGLYDTFEVISLAAQSLSLIKDSFILSVSHLGLVETVIDALQKDDAFKKSALEFISEKNAHDLAALCEKYAVSEEGTNSLILLASTYGNRKTVIKKLKEFFEKNCAGAATGESAAAIESAAEEKNILTCLKDLEAISALLDASPYADKIQFDFSLGGDTNYYNDFVFNGFVDGIATHILSGGQYDKMMQKMGRESRAIGFAIYLDTLEQKSMRGEVDVDTVVLYDDTVPAETISAKVAELVAAGVSVSAEKTLPEKLRYREILDLTKNN